MAAWSIHIFCSKITRYVFQYFLFGIQRKFLNTFEKSLPKCDLIGIKTFNLLLKNAGNKNINFDCSVQTCVSIFSDFNQYLFCLDFKKINYYNSLPEISVFVPRRVVPLVAAP
jgi:hypothetical protein